MPDDAYAGIADLYDRFHGRFGEHDPAEIEFYSGLFSRNETASVLDCACGTGRHLHLYHTLGLEATGSDLSPTMIQKARANLRSVGANVPIVSVDYRCLADEFSRRFDAVVCLSSSILHMENDHQVIEALSSMRGVLRRGGLLVLSQGTTDKQWSRRPRFILALDEPDLTRLFVIDYLGAGARYNIVDVRRQGAGAELAVWGVEYAHMLLHDDYGRLLREVGFDDLVFFGSYAADPYDRLESDQLIMVARS